MVCAARQGWAHGGIGPDGGDAHDLYSNLRELDHTGCDAILIEQPPEAAEWFAIRDRLTRAAAGSGEVPD
ncbi:MAG: Sua5 family C-terminal domain-containing protein [Burkholderiales bacterium]|nr:Sua5 family C-terminal domain-containing protein [Burkholderiales bacterium]